MRTTAGNRIRDVLRGHVGQENAISAHSICAELGIPAKRERQVRAIIATEASLWGDMVVCGLPSGGYFVCADLEEAAKYERWLLGLFTTAAGKFLDFVALCLKHGLRLPDLDEQHLTAIESIANRLLELCASARKHAAAA